MDVFTIGYERAAQPDVIDRLQTAGVDTLVDVRAVAASRRAGFSKTLLRESLAAAGIDYIHLRGLGTPKAGREAARAGRIGEMRALFSAHLREPQAVVEFEALRALASDRRVALLCFESDPQGCHRTVLSDRLAQEAGFTVIHL